MSYKSSAFLEQLFPDPIYVGKGRVARYKPVKLTAKKKAYGVVKKWPEVMLKIGKADIKSFGHLMKAADYIARHGNLEVTNEEGITLSGKEEYRKILEDWKRDSEITEVTGKIGQARRLIISMPAGTDEKKFQAACRDWAKDALNNHEFLMSFHLSSNDKKTRQPHCHILLKTLGKDGRRFHMTNGERDIAREHLASTMLRHGIECNATKRWSRGKTERAVSQAESHRSLKQTAESAKDRARKHAIARKKKALKTQVSHTKNVAAAFVANKPIKDHPAITQAKQTRNFVLKTAGRAAKELSESKYHSDRELGKELKKHYENLGLVESREQRELRELNEKKAQQIKRMQAMKSRLKNDRDR